MLSPPLFSAVSPQVPQASLSPPHQQAGHSLLPGWRFWKLRLKGVLASLERRSAGSAASAPGTSLPQLLCTCLSLCWQDPSCPFPGVFSALSLLQSPAPPMEQSLECPTGSGSRGCVWGAVKHPFGNYFPQCPGKQEQLGLSPVSSVLCPQVLLIDLFPIQRWKLPGSGALLSVFLA